MRDENRHKELEVHIADFAFAARHFCIVAAGVMSLTAYLSREKYWTSAGTVDRP